MAESACMLINLPDTPSENGNNKPGERQIIVVWYYSCVENSMEYIDIMTGINGL
jgi:hypothetical protein